MNSTAKPGDNLILTKPIGFGILATGLKAGKIKEDDIETEIKAAAWLNQTASEAMVEIGVSACTDITGFGLLGHLYEMAQASGLQAEIDVGNIPYWPKAKDIASLGLVPGGARANQEYIGKDLLNKDNIDPILLDILCDPQTSGGLLVSLPADKAEDYKRLLDHNGEPANAIIGTFQEGSAGQIVI